MSEPLLPAENNGQEQPLVNERRVLDHLSLVERCIPHFSTEPDDVRQAACEALVDADRRFDQERGVPFGVFARRTVEGSVKKYFRDNVWKVRVPRTLKEDVLRVDQAEAELVQELREWPNRDVIAQRTGLTEERVETAQVVKQSVYRGLMSLDAKRPTDDGRLASLADTIEERMPIDMQEAQALRDGLEQHDPRSQAIIRLYFWEGLNQVEISRLIGVSQAHTSRLLRQALEQLKEMLSDNIE